MANEWTISPAGGALGDVVGARLSEEPLKPEQVALMMTVVLSDLLRSWEGVLREARTGRLEGSALEMQRSGLIADAVTQCGWFARGL